MARAEQNQRLGELTLKGGKDPDNFGTAIASLKMEYNNMLAKEDKIAILFSVAGEKYATMILSKRKLPKNREEVTFDALVVTIHEVWQVNRKKKILNGATETLLADENYMSDFAKNKKYFHCHKKIHLKFHCPELKGKRGTPLGMVYKLCGQMGHTKNMCWDGRSQERKPKAGKLGI